MFDIIIRNGTVIDGTRADRFRADVGIEKDRITAVGDLSAAQSAQAIDAQGKVVSPGFIDVHNHSDGWMIKTRQLPSNTLQGFTTEVLMSDGISYAPVNQDTWRDWLFYLRALDGLRMDEYTGWESIAEFMACIEGHNVQNVVAQIPYANVRTLAAGFGRGPIDDFQMREICRRIRIGMQEGAIGLSTGLDYIVQCFSTTDELVEACSAMAEYDGIYVTHMRYKKGILAGLQEAVDICRRAGVKLHVSHLKTPSQEVFEPLMDYIDNVARKEVDFSFDVYPYQPGSTMLSYMLPYDVWTDGTLASLGKMNDPVIRSRFADGIKAYRLDLDHIRIAWVAGKENTQYQGMLLSEYVEAMGQPAEEALLNLLIEERLGVLLVFDEGDDRLGYPFLQHECYMMGSDGIYAEGGQVHPRQYGSMGRILGPLVRDEKLFTLEEAVHKCSYVAAKRFGLKDRGEIREGAFADVVVFDAETISDPATYDEPRQHTIGIEHVLVNGVQIVRDATPLEDLADPLPGRYLRYEPGR